MDYFTDLRETHSWSSVKLDLYGLKLYHAHVLKKPGGAGPDQATTVTTHSGHRVR